MDYGSLAIATVIVAYGAVEYRRREHLHRTELGLVRRGEVPPERVPGYPRLTLMSTGGALALLLVSAALMMFHGAGIPRYGPSIAALGVLFLILSIPVAIMF